MMTWRCSLKASSPTRLFIRPMRSSKVLKTRFRFVPVFLSFEYKHTRTVKHKSSSTFKQYLQKYLWPARLTAYYKISHSIRDIFQYHLLIPEIHNVDNWIQLRGKKEDFIVWIHVKAWNLWKQEGKDQLNTWRMVFSVAWTLTQLL